MCWLSLFKDGTGALGLSALRTSYLQAAMAIGIGAGSVAAGYFFQQTNRVRIYLRWLELAGLSGGLRSSCVLPHLGYWTVFGVLAALGFFAGFFAVPINALIQHQPPIERRGSVIATANFYFRG